MSFKKSAKIFSRAFARHSMFASSWIISKMSMKTVRVFAHVLIAIAYTLVLRQKKIARESLQIAFGKKKTPEEIEAVIKHCFENLGMGMVEMLYFLSNPQEVSKYVHIEGKQYLDEALKQGNGAIAVTAHFGNFPLMMMHFALEGYKASTIIRPARDEKLEQHLLKKRTETGLRTIYAIPRKQCVNRSLKVLRDNEILFVPLDQNFGSAGGVYVDFFGQKAATATGPIVFATRTKAKILPVFALRQPDDSHKIIIEPPMKLIEGRDEQDTLVINTANITRLIESYIRQYPYEWGWMHRRWKSRPQPEVALKA